MDNPELEILPMKNKGDNIELGTNPNWFKWPASSIHIAATAGGKTLTCCNLLYNPNFDLINKLDEVYLFTGSGLTSDPSMEPFVRQFPQNLFDKYSDQKLQSILDMQTSIPKKNRPKLGIIVDDIAALGIKQNSLIWGLFTMARHFNIVWLHVMTQKLRMIPNVARVNASYLMIGRINNAKELESLTEEYGGLFGKEKFQECLDIATENPYNFLWCKIRSFKPELYHNFTTHLYTAEHRGVLSIKEDGAIPKKFSTKNEKEDEKFMKKK